jgi:hypothetical protein
MRLFTNGCSFTEGYDLPDPSMAWPSVLSNSIKYDVNNIALGGGSNDRIFRTTIEYFNIHTAPDIAIIGWTFNDRAELSHHSGVRLRLTSNACLPDTTEMTEDLTLVHKFWTTQLYNRYLNYHAWVHSILHLQEYFKSKKIQYLFFTAIGNDYIHEFINNTDLALELADQSWQWRDRARYAPFRNIHREYQDLRLCIAKIDLTHWVSQANYTMGQYLQNQGFKSDCTGHYQIDGHLAWANHLREYIKGV